MPTDNDNTKAIRSCWCDLTHEQALDAIALARRDLVEASSFLTRAERALNQDNYPHAAGALQDAAYSGARAVSHTHTVIGWVEEREAAAARARVAHVHESAFGGGALARADRTRLGVVDVFAGGAA